MAAGDNQQHVVLFQHRCFRGNLLAQGHTSGETPLCPLATPTPTSLKVTGSRAGSGSSGKSPLLPAAACSLSVWVVSTGGGSLIYFGSRSLRNVPI